MFQGFHGDLDSGSRGSSSPSLESQYLSSVDSFGSPSTTSAPPQECVSATNVVAVGSGTASGGAATGEMPGSFVPTVTAITTSQDLQWMVQPTLVSSVAPGGPPTDTAAPATMTQQGALDPYDLPGPSFAGAGFTPPQGTDTPGPTRSSRARSRRSREESLTPEEEEKRRVRRERNKLAAAKCRNRRRELTDRLQSETDVLEEEKAELEAEISELQKEKERLEFVLVAHQPSCKLPYQDPPASLQLPPQPQPPANAPQPAPAPAADVSVVGLSVKEDAFYLPPAYPSHLQPSTLAQGGGIQPPPAQPPPPPTGMIQELPRRDVWGQYNPMDQR